MNTRKWLNYFVNEGKEPLYNPKLSLIDERLFDDLDLTHYSPAELAILLEGRKQDAIKKWVMSEKEAEEGGWEDDWDMIHPVLAHRIIGMDGNHNYKHLNWIFKQITIQKMQVHNLDDQVELWEELEPALEIFIKNSQKMKKKDINQYKTIEELLAAIEEHVVQPRIDKARKKRRGHADTARMIRSGEGTVVYEDDRYFVVRPDTNEASCHFGSRTKWCISQHGNTYFSQYTQSEAKVFYFIKDDSKKNEDYNYKMAVQVRAEGGNAVPEMIWDRHDEPTDVEDYDNLANALHSEFEVPIERADQIEEAIQEHANEFLPESPLAELDEEIQEGKYDVGYVSFGAHYEDGDEHPYLSLNASVDISITFDEPNIVQIFDNMDAHDIAMADAEIVEQLQSDGIIYEGLAEDVDIGASKWWWPNEEELFQVELQKAPMSAAWYCKIAIRGFEDPDRGVYGNSDIQEAESFIEYMQDEWGTRNQLELEEALKKHILRSIPQIAKAGSDEFLKLKSMFTSGEHAINDFVYYDVDEEDDEMSDLNLYMTFTFPMTEDYINRIFKAEDLVNTSGNTVKIARAVKSSAVNLVISDFASEATGGSKIGYLEKGIYNVYAAAREYAYKQLKLPFPDLDTTPEEALYPDKPESLEVRIRIQVGRDGTTIPVGIGTIVPSDVALVITYQMYIPYHQTAEEMQKMYYFFKYVQDNYEQIHSYVRKYAKENLKPGRTGALAGDDGFEKVIPLKEDIQADVYDSLSYLQALNEYLEDL